jgi:hypothetical protein
LVVEVDDELVLGVERERDFPLGARDGVRERRTVGADRVGPAGAGAVGPDGRRAVDLRRKRTVVSVLVFTAPYLGRIPVDSADF